MKKPLSKTRACLLLLLTGQACLVPAGSTGAAELQEIPRPRRCDEQAIVQSELQRLIGSMPPELRRQIGETNIAKSDPLDSIEDVGPLEQASASVIEQLGRCRISSYIAIFADPQWGQRAWIEMVKQKTAGKPLSLSAVRIGQALESLDNLRREPLPGSCRPVAEASLMFTPNGTWYRTRIMTWAQCSDGGYIVWLPESGWSLPTDAQSRIISKHQRSPASDN